MNVFQPTKIIPEAKWISSILLFVLRLSPKLNECLPSYCYPQSYMNVFHPAVIPEASWMSSFLLILSPKLHECLHPAKIIPKAKCMSYERWIPAEGKTLSSLKTWLHTSNSDIIHDSRFLMGEELESSRFLTPDSTLLVPMSFLFSVHLHGVTFPFLSGRNILWTCSSPT